MLFPEVETGQTGQGLADSVRLLEFYSRGFNLGSTGAPKGSIYFSTFII